jgi:hypothetical protein
MRLGVVLTLWESIHDNRAGRAAKLVSVAMTGRLAPGAGWHRLGDEQIHFGGCKFLGVSFWYREGTTLKCVWAEKVVTLTKRSSNLLEFLSAVTGSFDGSAFVNPKTGGFCYPKYKSPTSAIVRIKDITNYREDFTTLSDADDVSNPMSLFELELDNANLDLELTSLEDVFDSIVRRGELFPKLRGLGSELLSLASDPDLFRNEENLGLPKGFQLLNENERGILDAGMLQTFPVEPGSELDEVVRKASVESFNVETLKRICDENKLAKSGKKDDLIERILAAKAVFQSMPLVKVNSRKLDSLLDLMTDIYVDDIKSSIDKWHPLFLKHVWSAAKDWADCEIVDRKIDAILANPYWATRLTLIKI